MSDSDFAFSRVSGPQFRPRALLGILLFFIAAAFTLFLYGWTLRTSNVIWENPQSNRGEYYCMLARGFAQGHLSLDYEPDPRLLALADPYPPENRLGIPVLHDASYYQGRYFLYWGPAPALVLFLPYRLATGMDLPMMYGHLIFSSLGFCSLAILFLRLRADFFPESRIGLAMLGIVALGVAGFTLAVLRRNSVWELPIAAGHGFAMPGLLFAYLGLRDVRPMRHWWISSFFFGLTIASRPTYAIGIAGLMLVFFTGHALARNWRTGGADIRELIRNALAFGTPCLILFLGLLWYNHARFGSALEFGLRYQLSAANEMEATRFTFRYAAHNFYLYYLSPARWGRYFPFIQLIPSPASQPPGYYGMEYTYGLFANVPLTWLAFVLPFSSGAIGSRRALWRISLIGFGLFFLAVSVALLGFWAAAQRYMVDFAPMLILLGLLGALVCESWTRRLRPWLARLCRVCLGAVILAAIAFGLCASFQLHGLFKYFSPETYASIARFANRPTCIWERLTGFEHGPIELKLRFPTSKPDRLEPLLMTGWEFYSDQLYVHYVDDHRLYFGFDHVSRGGKRSDIVTVDYSVPHSLLIEMGSLYPPEGHPFFEGMSEAVRSSYQNLLRLSLDGKVVLESTQSFYDASPESIRIGTTCYPSVYGSKFTGDVMEVIRRPLAPMPAMGLDGEILGLLVALPASKPMVAEPLLAIGNFEGFDTVYVRHLPGGRICFGYQHGAVEHWESPAVRVDYSRQLRIDVAIPGLSRDALEGRRGTLDLSLSGLSIWRQEVPCFPADARRLVLGQTKTATDVCMPRFDGGVTALRRPGASKGEPVNPDLILLSLIFASTAGDCDPLVVWGRSGKADLLRVEYLENHRIRFGVDHWGTGLIESDPIEIDPGIVQFLDVKRTSAPDSTNPHEKILSISLNDSVVWTARHVFYDVADKDLEIGSNEIGASTCRPKFSGKIMCFK